MTFEEEEELIARYPYRYHRDDPICIGGKLIYAGLYNANPNCNHLVKNLYSGERCIKCGGWYCV